MGPQKGQIVQVQIEKMAYGGQGVARLDGLVIFVRGTLPGDRIQAKVVKKKKNYLEAKMTDLIEPSQDRVRAPCPYSGQCGGCQWQHVSYGRQLAYKKAHIQEALSHIAGLPKIPVKDVIPSQRQLHYRNKMEFSFSDRPWTLPREMGQTELDPPFALGLHVPGTFSKVIDIDACLLQHQTGNRTLQEVKRYVRDSGIPVYGLKSHRGFWRFLTLRYSEAMDEWMVNLVTSEERPVVVEPLAEALCRRIDNIKTVVNTINTRKAAIAIGEREVVLSGEGFIREKIGPYWFHVSANSFFQTNTATAEKLFQKVGEYAELKGSEVVLDLYSGTGTIPTFLSAGAGTVIGLEIEKSAVLDAQRNCTANEVHNCQFILGDIREGLSRLRLRPQVLIIDPPRAGMHRDVLAKVTEMATEKVVYISCNPATMARDLGQLSQHYEVLEIQPVDMFPQTYHIEAVAKLIRKREVASSPQGGPGQPCE